MAALALQGTWSVVSCSGRSLQHSGAFQKVKKVNFHVSGKLDIFLHIYYNVFPLIQKKSLNKKDATTDSPFHHPPKLQKWSSQ